FFPGDQLRYFAVLDLSKLGCAHRARFTLRTRVLHGRRPQNAADMIGSERRLASQRPVHPHICHRLTLNCQTRLTNPINLCSSWVHGPPVTVLANWAGCEKEGSP